MRRHEDWPGDPVGSCSPDRKRPAVRLTFHVRYNIIIISYYIGYIMVICFEASKHTRSRLDILIEDGQYEDYGDVIAVAVANLAVLQSQVRSQGALVLDFSRDDVGPEQVATEGDLRHSTRAPIRVPDLFETPGAIERQTRSAPMPTREYSSGEPIPLERWLFGQYNRILPLKASCRGLANMLVGQPDGLLIDEAAATIVEAASQLGMSLRRLESKVGLHRDDALSTAFPSSGKRAEKSKLRFASQFVVATTKTNDLTGLPSDLGLVNYTSPSKDSIALTEPGWRFAAAPNPVLDGNQKQATDKLGDEECEVLLSHICEAVPREDFAFRAVLAAVRSGRTSPNQIDEDFVRLAADNQVSPAFISTQRSGAVSRMVDLGLLVRSRRGVRVEYVLTEGGENYLARKPVAARGSGQ